MGGYGNRLIFHLFPVFFFLLTSCATSSRNLHENDWSAYVADHDATAVRQHLPVFVVAAGSEKHNLIGTPRARIGADGKEEIFVDPDRATIYAESRKFSTANRSYTNLIYRIHFEKVPFSIVPFHLGWGKNVGVIVVVTLNQQGEPVLYTTVQTCGCYLAFLPTSFLPQSAFPDNWMKERQTVYGENLPSLLDFKGVASDQVNVLVFLGEDSHRVTDLLVTNPESFKSYHTIKAELQPLDSLQRLPLAKGGATSFYELAGPRKGYVKGSTKPWERLLMGWWAFDWKVGEDKKLGLNLKDGTSFYTSLGFWARDNSDMRDFPSFLRYWGWDL